jgi:uncharacterized protein YbcC (UPF0753/DUF2309 family)
MEKYKLLSDYIERLIKADLFVDMNKNEEAKSELKKAEELLFTCLDKDLIKLEDFHYLMSILNVERSRMMYKVEPETYRAINAVMRIISSCVCDKELKPEIPKI